MAGEYLRGVSLGARIVGQGFDEYHRARDFQARMAERGERKDFRTFQRESITRREEAGIEGRRAAADWRTQQSETQTRRYEAGTKAATKRHAERMKASGARYGYTAEQKELDRQYKKDTAEEKWLTREIEYEEDNIPRFWGKSAARVLLDEKIEKRDAIRARLSGLGGSGRGEQQSFADQLQAEQGRRGRVGSVYDPSNPRGGQSPMSIADIVRSGQGRRGRPGLGQ